MAEKRAYIIYTLDYRNQSHGVRAIHKLCHILRQKGYEAYVTSKVLNNRGWNTPTLFHDRKKLRQLILDGAIAVYPEGNDNVLYSKSPVSWWLLPRDSRIELRFVYHQSFDVNAPVMHVEDFEHELFNTKGTGKRNGEALYLGKGCQIPGHFRDLEKYRTKDSIDITRDYPRTFPKTRKELAKILKRVKILYTADPASQINAEAMMCGCPVKYVGNSMPKWAKEVNDASGVYYEGTEESTRVFREVYAKREAEQDALIDKFIEITQNYWVNGTPDYGIKEEDFGEGL